MTISQLEKETIENGTILWAKIHNCFTHQGYIEVIIEDNRGQTILLSVFFQPYVADIIDGTEVLNYLKIANIFSEKCNIGIKQPYLTLSGAG